METFVPVGNISGPIIPEFALPLAIPAGAKLVYALLCRHCFKKDHCWPSHASLAQRLGCSINSIKSWLRELARVNLIMIQEVRGHSSIYTLLKPPAEMLEAAKTRFQPQKNHDPAVHTQPDFDNTQPEIAGTEANLAYGKDLKKKIMKNPLPHSQIQ